MLSSNKDFLMSKFKFVEFPSDLFCNDISQDEEIVDFNKNNFTPQLSHLSHLQLSSCFVPQEETSCNTASTTGPVSPPAYKSHKKSIEIVKGSNWRKHSESEKKSDSFKESHEVDIKINPSSNGNLSISRRKSSNISEIENVSGTQEYNFQNNNEEIDKISQILSIVKINKKKSKKINIKIIFAINQKLQVNNDFPIWYLNIKNGISSNYDLLLGPFSSIQIVEFYENNFLNDISEIRLYLDFEEGYNVNDKEILDMHGKYF